MRESMIQLSGFLGRRRRWVLAAWVVVLLVALPIASHQTDHLTGGGFDVPGSQSKAVTDSVEKDFGGRSDSISVLLKADDSAGPAARAAAVDRVRAAVSDVDGLSLPPAEARRTEAQLQKTGTALAPLRSDQGGDELIDSALTLRSDIDPGTAENGVTTYLAGQPTIWAGMQELS
jgi:uncharacterized membrane protein YdfJ with MMPL/SSD domain